ncbi:MAG TPA: ABC transporter ATP-binding protein [Bacteroidota bacterium]|nr:ABC transporter ATP-binding protein [Bacteroidota bacterium]
MIELRNLVKKFGSFTAVDDVSLRIEPGTFFGFLGPNGAGKTTTIKMMTGLYQPTAGSCLIAGHDIQKDPDRAKRNFGYVPDQPYLYEKLSGREFLHFVGGLFQMPGDLVSQRIDELIDVYEIGHFIDKRGEEYSQGMRQRIVLSAALLHQPKVLIIDEPLVGLDPRSARLVKDTLKKKTREGVTVFMSTHLLEIVEELCDRIAIIKDGRIIHEEVQNEARAFNGQLEAMFLELTK